MTKENLMTPDHIRTASGLYIDPFNPKPELITIEDIAHGLAHVCRFAGHTQHFYSVAQHSLRVTYMVKPQLQLQALLHDASEAYLGDMAKPIKQRLPEYVELENNLMLCIAKKFGFEWPVLPDVKEADKVALKFEWSHLVLNNYREDDASPDNVRERFLLEFKRLTRTMEEVA